MEGNVPVGIKITSIIYYILAVLMFILGIAMFFGASALAVFPIISPGILIILGIVFLAIAALEFFAARELWKGQKWARIVIVILTFLWLIVAVVGVVTSASLIGSIIGIIICLYILGNIFFSTSSKELFI